jgi:hypothetical protein
MGISRNYQINLEILDERVELTSPAGRKFIFPTGLLPAALYGLVRQCIQDDQANLRSLEDLIRVDVVTQPAGDA